MSVAKQLYQLQEIDLEIESAERTLKQKVSQLGETEALTEARARLTAGQKQRDELKHRQQAVEWDIDDLTSKIKGLEEQLYSGRIKNPKELTNLQHEVEMLKAKRDHLETNALETMDQVEKTEGSVAAAGEALRELETEWQEQQQQLAVEIEALKSKLSELNSQRQQLGAEIKPGALELYEKLRRQKGQAVARVEQGICRGCRISLPSSDLQRARSGDLVPCGSCGRILFLS